MFQCTACVPNQRTITFEIFGENITTADKSCTINSSIRTCNRVIDSHLVSLTCDYSTDYQINCTLSVDNVTRSSEVFCRVLNQSTIEAMERAAVLVVGKSQQGHKIPTSFLFFYYNLFSCLRWRVHVLGLGGLCTKIPLLCYAPLPVKATTYAPATSLLCSQYAHE